MKKTYIILTLFIAAVFATSCETSWNEFETDRGDTLGFTFPGLEMGLNEGQTIEFPANYFVTSVSSEDRAFDLEVVESESEMTSDNYSFDSSIVVPAGERSGTMFFTLTNNSLPDEYTSLVVQFLPTASVTSGKRAIFSLKSND